MDRRHLEPLLGSLPDLDLAGIHWVIVGGESGPKTRPVVSSTGNLLLTVEATWIREIRNRCQCQDAPFFFKQWGGTNKKAAGRLLYGRI